MEDNQTELNTEEGSNQTREREVKNPMVFDMEQVALNMEKPKKRRGIFRFPFNIIFVLFALVILSGVAFGGYRVYERVTFKRTILSLLPNDTEYFARVTIDKNHEQVKIAHTLVEKFPGAHRLSEEIKKYLIEILRQPLDPFESIFSLAEKEIFLAKISQRNEGAFLDQLVNIIEVANKSKIVEAGETLKKSDKIKLDSYAYKGKQITHAALSEMGNLQFEQFLGPVPYGLTIPFSKEAYFTDFDNFLVSADKKTDIEDIATLTNEQSSLMKNANSGSILEEKSFKNLIGRMPKSYLLQFYQKQKAIPNVTQFPGEFGTGFIIMESFRNLARFTPQGLVKNFVPSPLFGMVKNNEQKAVGSKESLGNYTASIVDNLLNKITGKSRDQKENVYDAKIGRAFTLSAQNEGIDFATLQEQYDLSVAQFFGAKNLMFNLNDSLVNKVPLKINSAEVGVWFEIANLSGQIEFAEKMLDELIKGAPDDETRTLYKQQKELIDGAFDSLSKEFFEGKGVTREDLMEVLSGRFAFYLAPRFGGQAPSGGIILRAENIQKVEDVFSKISYETAGSSLPKKQVEAAVHEEYNGAKIYWLPEGGYSPTGETIYVFWIIAKDIAIFSVGENSDEIKTMYDFYVQGNAADSLANSPQFQFEKSRTPGDVLMLFYMKPYSFWGLAEYIYELMAPLYTSGAHNSLEEAAGKELSHVIKSYLKTMDHLYSYTSGNVENIISSLFFRIIDLPQNEKDQAEQFIGDLLEGRTGPLAKQKVSERNSDRLRDGQIWANALGMYGKDKGHYPMFEDPIKITYPFDNRGQEFVKELASSGVASFTDPQDLIPLLDPMYDKGFYYEYKSINNGKSYILTMRMEGETDYYCDRTISETICIYAVRPETHEY